MPTLRVATFNAHGFREGVTAATELFGPQSIDLVLVQECGSKLRLRRFAAAIGMEFVSSHRLFSRVRNAVVYRAGWRAGQVRVRTLSHQNESLPRGFVAARIRAPHWAVTAVSAHLGLVDAERVRHAGELTDFLAGVDGPVVVGVDFNEGPDARAARWMSERLYDAHVHGDGPGGGETFPAQDPTARIDYVFVNSSVTVRRCWVPQGEEAEYASDHRPVFAELVIPEG